MGLSVPNGACTKAKVLEPRAPRLNIACMHRPLERGPICGPGLEYGNQMSRTTNLSGWAGRCLVFRRDLGRCHRSHVSHMEVSLTRLILSGIVAARGWKWKSKDAIGTIGTQS